MSAQDRPQAVQSAASLDLEDSLQFHLQSVVKFQRAQGMQIMETRPMTIANNPAVFLKDQYFDPLEKDSWLEEVIFVSRGDQLYRLELVCRAKEVQRFERIFQRVVESFSFRCNETH